MDMKKSAKKQLPKPEEYSLSERIKYLRDLRGMTQTDLARIAKVSQATVAQIESARKDPSVTTLKKLASALDVSVAIMFATDSIHIFDMVKLRRKYKKVDELNPTLYRSLDQVIRYAKDIGFL